MITAGELAKKIAYHITTYPEQYDQEEWGNAKDDRSFIVHGIKVSHVLNGAKCRTPACVAGWAVRLGANAETDPNLGIEQAATRLLGIDADDAYWLFSALRTPEKMPAILEHLAATGKVDWSMDKREWE